MQVLPWLDEGGRAANPIRICFAEWGNTEGLTLFATIAGAHMKEDSSIEIENLGFSFFDFAQRLFARSASGGSPEKLRTGMQVFPNRWAGDALLPLTELVKPKRIFWMTRNA